jgi:hypothetical protein
MMPGMEIESLQALDELLGRDAPLCGLRLQDLDLTGHEGELLGRADVEGLVVLGGRLSPALDAHLRGHGALIFPTDPHAPVNPYRATLYQPHELYAGVEEHGYEQTPDARAYHWSRDATLHHDAFVTLLRAIHDDSISDALTEFLGGRPVAGVMGGHALLRGTDGYAAAARLGHGLAARRHTPARWRRPTSEPSARTLSGWPTRWPAWGRSPPSSPTSGRGRRSPSACTMR